MPRAAWVRASSTAIDIDKPSKPPFDKGGFCLCYEGEASTEATLNRPFQGLGV